ncbi:MAG TPA: envelope stress response membrane protein PspB [Alphaproteobacteria bacterium]|nr:envelope stress response membrane protein PspB [Alphaproteobacteria bacterium]
MDEWGWVLFVPLILFVVVVLPKWLRLHYGADGAGGRARPAGDATALRAGIARLEQRIATLERLLDAEDPQWRERT